VSAPLRIKLNPEEEKTLTELHKSQLVHNRVRKRALMLKLNAQGRNVPEIARRFNCHQHTVRATIKRWENLGLAGLRDAHRPGRTPGKPI
jgi:transposase